jgi:hypothetical protein
MQKRKQLDLQSREIRTAVEELYSKYGKHALPDQEARKIVDQAMGTKSLTEALDAMRNG